MCSCCPPLSCLISCHLWDHGRRHHHHHLRFYLKNLLLISLLFFIFFSFLPLFSSPSSFFFSSFFLSSKLDPFLDASLARGVSWCSLQRRSHCRQQCAPPCPPEAHQLRPHLVLPFLTWLSANGDDQAFIPIEKDLESLEGGEQAY